MVDFDLFDIDKGRLDDELENQPKLFLKYSLKLADAKRDLEAAKAALDLTYAETDSNVRLNPEKFGLEKATEPAIKQAILSSKRYKEADAEVRRVKHDADVFQAYVSALDHRKRALEGLIELLKLDYWAAPRMPKGGIPESVTDATKKETMARVNARTNSKTRK